MKIIKEISGICFNSGVRNGLIYHKQYLENAVNEWNRLHQYNDSCIGQLITSQTIIFDSNRISHVTRSLEYANGEIQYNIGIMDSPMGKQLSILYNKVPELLIIAPVLTGFRSTKVIKDLKIHRIDIIYNKYNKVD